MFSCKQIMYLKNYFGYAFFVFLSVSKKDLFAFSSFLLVCAQEPERWQ